MRWGASPTDDSLPPMQAAATLSPEDRSAAALAQAVIASPTEISHRWAPSFGGVDLDDDVWEIRFNFLGEDNLERTLCRSDITRLNLLALIEGYGYRIGDNMYYVKEKGKGKNGMVLISSMTQVNAMIDMYEEEQVLNITILKKDSIWPSYVNIDDVEAEILNEPVIFSVDSTGVNYTSGDDDEFFPVAMDMSDVLFLGTQQSSKFQKAIGPIPIPVDVVSEDKVVSEDDDFFYPYQVDPEDHNRSVMEELKYIQELKRKKKEQALGSEHGDILKKMEHQRKQRDDPLLHFEGDTDVEELQYIDELKRKKKEQALGPEHMDILKNMEHQRKQRADPLLHFEGDTDVEEMFEPEEVDSDWEEPDCFLPKKMKPSKPGPTSRSHHELEEPEMEDFLPSSDEESSPADVGDSDDDGSVPKFNRQSGKKRKLKKLKKRIWYDPDRADPHRQFCIKLCFNDVYQFRTALRSYHIAQLRNFHYHRNCSDRIIAWCTKEGKKKGCKFFITASKIAHEKTFCIRKFMPQHTCIPHGENTKGTIG